MPEKTSKAQDLIRRTKSKRDVYVISVDVDSMKPEDCPDPDPSQMLAALAESDLNGECEYINVGYESYDEINLDKFKVMTGSIKKGKIEVAGKQILVKDLSIDTSSYASKPYATEDGSRFVFRFRPLFGIDSKSALETWRRSRSGKEAAAAKLLSYSLSSSNIEYVAKKNKGVMSIKLFKDLSWCFNHDWLD
jgi:hypothetical protein